MKKVSVIFAFPPHFNPGMHSVDYALWQFINRHDLNSVAEFKFYTMLNIPKDVCDFVDFPFTYELSDQNLEVISNSDLIIFWGDFLHSKNYLENEIFSAIKEKYPENNEDLIKDIIYRNLLLENIDLSNTSIIVFGGNLLDFRINYYKDDRYISSLCDLYKAASLILMRDPISAVTVNNLLNSYKENFCGIDGAFLSTGNKTKYLYRNKVRDNSQPYKVGIFFGRSWYYDEVLSFSCKTCNHLGVKGIWLPWFHFKPWPLEEKYEGEIDLTVPDTEFFGTLDNLAECSLVITDTYHLCINAWSLGIPAICIGRGVGSMKNSVEDKKKEVLYSMLDARDFYVYAEDVLTHYGKTDLVLSITNLDDDICSMIETLTSISVMENVFDRIDNHVASTENRILSVFRDQLL